MLSRKSHRRQFRVVMEYWQTFPNGNSTHGTVDFGPYLTLASIKRVEKEYQRVIDVYNEDEERRGSGITHRHRATRQVMYPKWVNLG